jgi:hypothetical protein
VQKLAFSGQIVYAPKRCESWIKANKVPFDDSPTSDYDMRGFWKSAQEAIQTLVQQSASLMAESISMTSLRRRFIERFRTKASTQPPTLRIGMTTF